jgi:hypothetical protein
MTMNTVKLAVCLALTTCLTPAALAQTGGGASTNLSLDLPDGWRATQTQQGAILVPADSRGGAGGPEEMYLVCVTAAPPEATLRDPRVAQALLAEVVGRFPGYQLLEQPHICGVGGEPGVRVTLGGANPATRQEMLIDLRLTIGQGRMILLTAAGTRQAVAPRLATIDRIAATLRCGAVQLGQPQPDPRMPVGRPAPQPMATDPNLDPALVGAWQTTSSSSYVSPSYGGDSFSMSTQTVITMCFYPDGSALRNVSARMAGGTGDVSADTGHDGGQNCPFAWAARGGVITTRTADGANGELRYQVSGDTLITVDTSGRRTTYTRMR